MRLLSALLIGLVFGIGIATSGMINPAKVLNFFDIVGNWDPGLTFVVGGALAVDRVAVNGSGANGEPLGIIPGAATYGIPVTPVGATATWAAFRAEVVGFMQANAITSANQVNLGFDPEIWAALDDALITGTAVSEWDRLTKHVGTPATSNTIPNESAIMTANV